jgi:hypothetical protein
MEKFPKILANLDTTLRIQIPDKSSILMVIYGWYWALEIWMA